MKLFASLLAAVILTATPVSASAAATGMHWNLGTPVVAVCADGTILNTTGKVAGGLLSVREFYRRLACLKG